MARQVLENGVILPAEYSDDWYDDMTSNLTKLDDVIGSDSEKLSSADVGAAALSNNYNDLDNLPTIPTVNDATLTIQKNGVDVQTFTANASSNVTANITVPTKTSDLTNDSNFVDTSNSAVASGITSAKVTDYDTHIAGTDIHVTTADKTKWNNGVSQAYVFRYSSTALTPSSTNSNTLLDNTDNLKVGDKVIDSDGVLFSITAIDTANSTFTIGTALVDLAQDSNVVHKSGNETITGAKIFSDSPLIYNSDSSASIPQISLKNQKVVKSSTTETGAQLIYFVDKNNNALGQIEVRVVSNGTTGLNITSFGFDSNNQNIYTGVQILRSPTTANFAPNADNAVTCGRALAKWSDVQTYQINGLTPSSLGMPVAPSSTSYVDISGYITVLDSSSANTYTPPSNGYITFSVTGNLVQIFHDNGLQGKWSIQTDSVNRGFIPVLGGVEVKIYITASNIDKFWFIPCQGNV